MELIGPVQPATPRDCAVAHRLYRAGTDTPYPGAEFPVTRALAGEASVVDDLEVEHPHRGRARLRAWGAPLLDAEGQVALAVVAFADVTVEKLLESVFDQQVRALERERIAEGIHDDVLQLLAAARLHLGNLRPRAREEAASGAGYPDTDVGSSPGPLPALGFKGWSQHPSREVLPCSQAGWVVPDG